MLFLLDKSFDMSNQVNAHAKKFFPFRTLETWKLPLTFYVGGRGTRVGIDI